MAQYQAGYGDQMRKTDEYGNPLQHTGGITGAGGHPTQTVEHDRKQEHGIGATLQRSNSSSSSDPGKMAQYQAGYGDQMRKTDEYGNPLQHTGGITGAGGHPTQTVEHDRKQEHGIGATLQRSNSSSSSSEDDGEGGRRKKGLKDKIMEKLPGGKKEEQGETHSATAAPLPFTEGEHHEKKGLMDKIKDSLPGNH